MEKTSKFHFSREIKLESNPLLEAWLEIRWQLEPTNIPNFSRDPNFPFALGVFFSNVKNEFGYREPLGPSHAPEDMLPYVVRYRFRPGKDEWPLLQLGPGVATVNFTEPYTWDHFEEKALYLRERLLDAYGKTELKPQLVVLRYRNGEPLEYGSNNLLDFFNEDLNTSITLPAHIPGFVSSVTWPTSANISFTFDLLEPKGTGTLRLGTGSRQRIDKTNQEITEQMVIWQLEVASGGNDAPALTEEDEFAHWLTSAHAVIHEWFFSLIEGPLFRRYKGEIE
jgi:uncharacterized protein (TIGR04255 family)